MVQGRPIAAQSNNAKAKAAWKLAVKEVAIANWKGKGWPSVSTPVRFTIVICDQGQIGDVDNGIKVALDGLWVAPGDPDEGNLPLTDDKVVQQVVATRIDVTEPDPGVESKTLISTLLEAATIGKTVVYIRLDDVIPTAGLLA
jgi:hypothetical protein